MPKRSVAIGATGTPDGLQIPSQGESDLGFTVETVSLDTQESERLKVETALTVNFWNTRQGIFGQGYYRTDLLTAATLQRVVRTLRSIAERVTWDSRATLASFRSAFAQSI